MKNVLPPEIKADIEAIQNITAVEKMLEVVCRITGMGFAAVARVTESRWVAYAIRDEINFGLKPGNELILETTICNEIRQTHRMVVIDHVALDKTFACHITPAIYGFQSYISVPIILKNGEFFGTLCAIDPQPAHISTPETIGMFSLFSELIAFHLAAREELEATELMLREERKTAELREHFIAVLGHDLRNPVSAIRASTQMLNRLQLNEKDAKLANLIMNACHRVSGLIENMLDFARGRLGEGITLERKIDHALENTLDQVISEFLVIRPDKQIEKTFHLQEAVFCDAKRIAQLFSNLLGNALAYGATASPVKVEAKSTQKGFYLKVTNQGPKIPDHIRERLFQPYVRGESDPKKSGLGLGLYIAQQIAQAHGGALQANSTEEETSFQLNVLYAQQGGRFYP